MIELALIDGQWQPAKLGPLGLHGLASAPTGLASIGSGASVQKSAGSHLAGRISSPRSDGSAVSTSGSSGTTGRLGELAPLGGRTGRRATGGSLGMPSLPEEHAGKGPPP